MASAALRPVAWPLAACSVLEARALRTEKKTKAMMAIIATAAPTPMPAFAPVLKLVELLSGWDGESGGVVEDIEWPVVVVVVLDTYTCFADLPSLDLLMSSVKKSPTRTRTL